MTAELMERLIPDAGLVVFEGAGHFAYLEQPDRFCRIVDVFLATTTAGERSGVSPLVGPLVALAAIVWVMLLFRVVLVAARMFQIEEYESIRFLRWGLTREWLAHRAVWLGAPHRRGRAQRGRDPSGGASDRDRDRVARVRRRGAVHVALDVAETTAGDDRAHAPPADRRWHSSP